MGSFFHVLFSWLVATTFCCSGGTLVAYSDSQSNYVEKDAVTSPYIDNKKKRVVVLGTGWAGTSFLKNLNNSSYDVQVVSPRNYFAFTPLLPSVTCGTVEARSIVEPIRKIVRKVTIKGIFEKPLSSVLQVVYRFTDPDSLR